MMNLGLYYHVSGIILDGKVFMPSYFGVFIESLANEVDHLYLFLHRNTEFESQNCDFELKGKNIIVVDLGVKTPVWHRFLFYYKVFKGVKSEIKKCDAIIVRGPSPLAPYFSKYISREKIFHLVVGDYLDGADHLLQSTFRDKIIYLYCRIFDYQYNLALKNSNILVNSKSLLRKYEKITNQINLVRTSTLNLSDFFLREDTCLSKKINILYTGRIDPAKGIFELINATNDLIVLGYDIQTHIVGWEDGRFNRIIDQMKSLINKLNLEGKVVFHGFKSVGKELNEMYRISDIYIIPSYHEGFPRAIWEAMANSCPVIATNVGGIPETLNNGKDCILIEPHSNEEIVNAVILMVNNLGLRKSLISNGYGLAQTNTLDVQSKNMVSIIKTALSVIN
jgi:glycosyltransferase involved in cell wall biosynthesis